MGSVADFVEVISACEELQQMGKVVRKVEFDSGSAVRGRSSKAREFEDVCGDTLFVMLEQRQRRVSKFKVRSSKKTKCITDVVVRYKEREDTRRQTKGEYIAAT